MTLYEMHTHPPAPSATGTAPDRPQTLRRPIPSGGGLVWDRKTLAARNLSGLTVEQLDCVPASVVYLDATHARVSHRLGKDHENVTLTARRLVLRGLTVILG